jgi:hypothetical protein
MNFDVAATLAARPFDLKLGGVKQRLYVARAIS